MKISLEKKLLGFFIVILIIIGYLGWSAYSNQQKHRRALNLVEHTQTVISQTDEILSLDYLIETTARGYVLSNDNRLVDLLYSSVSHIEKEIDTLKQLTSDNASQQKRLDSLQYFTERKIDFSLSSVRLMQEKGFDSAHSMIASGIGIQFMENIRKIINEIKGEENRLLAERRQAYSDADDSFLITFVVQFLAILLLILVSYFVLRHNLVKRKNAELRVKESEHVLQSVIDNTSSFIYIKDKEGKYLLVNTSYEKYFKKTKDEIIGKTIYDLLPEEAATNLQKVDDFVFKNEKLYESEEVVPSLYGGVLYYYAVRFPIYDAFGKVYAVCGLFTDITQVKVQSNLVQDLYDNAPSGYYSLDADANIINANNTALKWLGYEKNELMGKSFIDFVLAPECIEDFKQSYPAFKEVGSVSEKELVFMRKNGSRFPVLLNETAVKDNAGNFLFSRSTIFDITERKKMEEELQIVNKELESFTYSVSHDLRAPLRIINGYADIISADYDAELNADIKKMLASISTNVKRMGQLIDDLLEFSRLGRRDVTIHQTDMNTIVANLVKEQLTLALPKTYEVNLHNLENCFCDSSLIKNVWGNMISNAFKYSRKKDHPVIEIGSCHEKNEIVYYVKDNGAGFDMRYYDKLFGVFQRLHKISEYEGTGVGLALANRIIKKHGGRIWADSIIDEGSTFYFSLPNQQNNFY